jgi:uncharacterized protein YeaO (DUF488 family)
MWRTLGPPYTGIVVRLKRVYDEPARADGFRVLVDRLWPRGVSKERAALGLWLKDIAPSNELRKWYGHEPEKWPEFRKRYRVELRGKRPLIDELRALERKHKTITLLYGARDGKRNEAVVLAELLA